MDERIKLLAEKAEDWADNQNFYESDYRDYLMEKFAQLIVAECAGIYDKIDNGNLHMAPIITLKPYIKHLGVEK
jgi:endo-alpha-1,4-polygalactosaminidase (GH114 family)